MVNYRVALRKIATQIKDRYGINSRKTITIDLGGLNLLSDGYTIWDLKFLEDQNYIFHYQITRHFPKREFGFRERLDDIYGLTPKGWKEFLNNYSFGF